MKVVFFDFLKLGQFDWKQTFSSFWILFAVIDVLGSVPIIFNIKRRVGRIYPGQIAIVAGGIMVSFLFLGPWLLNVFAIDTASFAVAGSLVLFILGLEMVLNVSFFHIDPDDDRTVSIVPLAFPIISGTGTLITLLTLKIDYAIINILCGTFMNTVLAYLILHNFDYVAKKLGRSGTTIVQKVMGIIVISIAVKIFRTNLFL